MKLYVNLFSLGRFLTCCSESQSLRKVLVHDDANVYSIDTSDQGEIEGIKKTLSSKGVKFKIK